ncbi:5-oxoprolinase subunit B family protein [Phycicoccus jejuensis]|uniref:5-oxoprolinase subunit B family protein n=1 Tax=Phycicoccus jejuensis TaxID=367299 RepID=UPI001FDEEF5C|nr:allophanate hydrolase subunit 1 [Phycicoccus jejuensis]
MSGVPVRILPAGEHAVLVEAPGLAEVLALAVAVRAAVARGGAPWSGVTDVVPAARTLLLVGDRLDPAPVADAVRRLAAVVHADASTPTDGDLVEVPVRYDGPDLDDVARLTGLTAGEVVAAHTGTPWRVAFGGFAPGFAYLVGGDPRLRVPRRDAPRPSVPAGSVGLAGEFSGVYPRASPGGWRLVGTTDVVLWDAEREPPALLRPGGLVRFVAVDG